MRLTPTILVVEDHEDSRRMLHDLLVSEGYDVLTASHGAEALRQIRRTPPDLIVLDLLLPWVNGIEVLTTLRTDPNLSKVPVVVTTATGATQQDLNNFRPVIVLRKPLDHAAVVTAVQTMLSEPQTPAGKR